MQFFKSLSPSARALGIVSALLIVIVVFWAGTAVGRKQAEFGYRWDRHYTEVFDGKNSPFAGRVTASKWMPTADHSTLPNGAVGKIIAINLPTIAVTDPTNTEKVVVVGSETAVRRIRSAASSTDLRIGDMITAVGYPDAQGRIVASFIRVMPPMPVATSSSQR